MTLQYLNQLPDDELHQHLLNCCGSEKWVNSVKASVPYGDAQSLLKHGESSWYYECGQDDWLQAFDHHPRIGEKANTNEKLKATMHIAVGEQAGVAEKDNNLIQRLHEANVVYEKKFGFTFIVFASGKTGEDMLALLEDRIDNSLNEELYIAMGEQWKITLLRLKKLLADEVFIDTRSHLSTHILDTTIGRPARDVRVSLFRSEGDNWQKIATGRTNTDGRIADLLPEGRSLQINRYKLAFQIDAYFSGLGQTSFYPEVEVIFKVEDDGHYHVPLLLNPFGYSTYRGS